MQKFTNASDSLFKASAIDGSFVGAVQDISNRQYHGLKSYWSSTALKYMASNSPAHFKDKFFDSISESKDTPSKVLGSLVHCLLLTPQEFESDFFIMPTLNLRTNDGKAERDRLLELNLWKTPVTEELIETARGICESVKKNKQAERLMGASEKREAAFFWKCPFSGLNFRSKLDISSVTSLVEFKTADDAKPEAFSRQAHNLHYDLSLIHYLEGLKQVFDVTPSAHFIVAETSPPYVTQCYKVGESMLQVGHAKWLDAVTKLENGVRNEKWHGYFDDNDEIPEINPPPWAVNQMIRGDSNGI